jgi:hypothetical protein
MTLTTGGHTHDSNTLRFDHVSRHPSAVAELGVVRLELMRVLRPKDQP